MASTLASIVFDTPAIAGVRVELRSLGAFKECARELVASGMPAKCYTAGHAMRVFDAEAWELASAMGCGPRL